jgi:zinc/manganese transport system permease protein
VVAANPVAGALLGSLVVAGLIGVMGERPRERDSSIGVILAAGLGLGVLLLSRYQGFASAATSILFGDIFGISTGQIVLLVALALVVLASMATIFRPLLFSSIDPELAEAAGIRARLLGIVFLVLLCVTVTEAAQVVGTLLVLSLAITPAAAASRLATAPLAVAAWSVGIALVATDGGLLASLGGSSVPPTVFVTGLSFLAYLVARLVGPRLVERRRSRLAAARTLEAQPKSFE